MPDPTLPALVGEQISAPLAVPVKWLLSSRIVPEPFRVYIEQREQMDDTIKYVVTCRDLVLNVSLGWEHEPIPSERTEMFIARTRFLSLENALGFYHASLR